MQCQLCGVKREHGMALYAIGDVARKPPKLPNGEPQAHAFVCENCEGTALAQGWTFRGPTERERWERG